MFHHPIVSNGMDYVAVKSRFSILTKDQYVFYQYTCSVFDSIRSKINKDITENNWIFT